MQTSATPREAKSRRRRELRIQESLRRARSDSGAEEEDDEFISEDDDTAAAGLRKRRGLSVERRNATSKLGHEASSTLKDSGYSDVATTNSPEDVPNRLLGKDGKRPHHSVHSNPLCMILAIFLYFDVRKQAM